MKNSKMKTGRGIKFFLIFFLFFCSLGLLFYIPWASLFVSHSFFEPIVPTDSLHGNKFFDIHMFAWTPTFLGWILIIIYNAIISAGLTLLVFLLRKLFSSRTKKKTHT